MSAAITPPSQQRNSSTEKSPVLVVDSAWTDYSDEDFIRSSFMYQRNQIQLMDNVVRALPLQHRYTFRTKKKVPKTGVMLV